MTWEEILAMLARLSELTPDEMTTLSDALAARANELLDAEPTDDVLAELREVSEALQQVAAENTSREADAQRRADEQQALRDSISQLVGADDEAGDDAGDEAPEGAADDAPADEAAPEGEPVNAGGSPAPPPAPARTRARPGGPGRRPAGMTPQPTPEPQLALVAAGTFDNIGVGESLADPERLAHAFVQAARASQGYRGPRVKIPVARVVADFPEERTLGRDWQVNQRRIRQVTSSEAITASGGICAPTEVRYDLPVIGEDSRPFRDTALARFGADRGGVRTLIPPVITDLDDAIDAWTEANDQNPSSPTTKPCLTIDCGDEDETVVDAITRCLETGNFRARYFPEQIDAWTALAAVNHARFAETRSITTVGNASLQITTGQLLGAAADVVANLDRAVAGMRSRHRDRTMRFRFAAPFWLRDLIRVDIARQMPVGSWDETLAAADARIDALFSSRGINVTWLLDGESGQVFAQQGDGALIGWPSTVITYLFVEGSWLFLDGGQLDLGIIRDSTLVGTNDFRMFAETFEATHFHGTPDTSERIVMDLCPDGGRSALIDVNPCTVGS